MSLLNVVLLGTLIIVSAFFSSSETGLMAINRYRLRHLARKGHRGAKRVVKLLDKPDRLLGVILIGNTFANLLAASLATLVSVHLLGDKIGAATAGMVATLVLTFLILIFAEITPKTTAVIYPQQIAFFASLPLRVLLLLFYPLVWLANTLSNGLLKIFGINVKRRFTDRLDSEELRTVVLESTGRINAQHQDMLLRILDFEKVAVDDVMIPRNEVISIDLNDDKSVIERQLRECEFTRLPIHIDDIDNIQGVVSIHEALNLLSENSLNKSSIRMIAREAYFIPESTPLHVQLLNFRKENQRAAFVVDEYGDIQGLVTLSDIIEEIVGEFTTDESTVSKLILPQSDGSFIVDGSVNLRELNRLMHWELPTQGPKTLSGLITEALESIPIVNTCLRVNGYPIEIMQVEDNRAKSVKVMAHLKKSADVTG